MNNQDILRSTNPGAELSIDNSEYHDYELSTLLLRDVRIALDISELYDYELVDVIRDKVDMVLDKSEFYDYELVDVIIGKVDMVLDKSEFYDYELGDETLDFIYYEPIIEIYRFILTEDAYVLRTHDNYIIQYH